MVAIKIGRILCVDCSKGHGDVDCKEISDKPLSRKSKYRISVIQCPQCKHKFTFIYEEIN